MSVPEENKQEESTSTHIGEVIDLIRDYAKQETVEPLKGAGRWLALGAAGAFFLAVGLQLLVLAVLRLLQTEVTAFDGAFSWVPYVVTFVATSACIVVSLSRVRKATLTKEKG